MAKTQKPCFMGLSRNYGRGTLFTTVTIHILLRLVYFFMLIFKQIHWSDRLKDFVPTKGLFPLHTFSVDVTECQLQSPCDMDIRQFTWSGKQQMASLKYECAFHQFSILIPLFRAS
ncbi:MAG: hypothetical protein JNL74_14425 [Fibrobacteres bacterium]|nr:hypothetical protein [Fibrobacterota bacterium]